MTTQRAQDLMSSIWTLRNETADTEEKLVAGILRLAAERVNNYSAQNASMCLIDLEDLMNLANEIECL